MKQDKSHHSDIPKYPSNKAIPFLLAKMNGRYIIIAALITGCFTIIAAIINSNSKPPEQQKTATISEAETENIQIDESDEFIEDNIPMVLPEPEKPHPPSAHRHNAEAKRLLDGIIKLHDKEIKPPLDKVFIELGESHKIDDKFGETYYFYGVAYLKLGDYYSVMNNNTQALNYYDESLYHFNKSEYSYIHQSNIYFDRGKTYMAIADIYRDEYIEKAKEYYKKALDDLEKVLVVKYNYPENVYFTSGNIYYKMEEYQKAVDDYTNALKTANDKYRPTRKDIYLNRSNANFRIGEIYFLNKDYENAIQHYELSIDDNHENFSAHFELGKIYTFQKRWRDAVRQFDIILERNPRNFDIETVRVSRKYVLSMIE
jgi:tetratricopeptide (TPR) repeat protein